MTKKKKSVIPRLPIWGWATIGAIIVGGLLAFAFTQPDHAGWRYGACKALLERTLKYPTTMTVIDGGESQASASLIFADTNPYGAEQIRVFECHYSTDAQGRTKLSKITMDRKAIPDEITQGYNRILPLFMGIETDTALPQDLPKTLSDLKK